MIRRFGRRLHVLSSREFSYNAGVLVSGGAALLIDPGVFPEEIAAAGRLAQEQGGAVRNIVLTHLHWDHVLGPERYPAVPVVACESAVSVAATYGRDIERQVEEWEREQGLAREQPFRMPRLGRVFEGMLELAVGGAELRLLPAPGHAPEQLVAYEPEEKWLWAGDMLSDIEIPFVMDNLGDYQRTLHALSQLDVRWLVPGHGNATDDAAEIRLRFDDDRAYLYELGSRTRRAVELGRSLAETQETCADIEFRNRPANLRPHRLNVATAYLEAGGRPEPGRTWSRLM